MANEERPFRIRPRRPIRQRRDEIRIWSTAFKRLIHLVRMSGKRPIKSGNTGKAKRSYSQRCAVRVSYSTNRTPGQWRAHGRYLARESARAGEGNTGRGFGPSGGVLNLSKTLDRWQSNGDERLFKIIISPEFGERLNLEELTHTFVGRVEHDLGTKFDWVAVTHFNTSHPHVHIALRGINDRGQALRFEPDYIRVVMRRHAEDLCTSQIGFRSKLDAEDAQRREIDQPRYTSLDAIIRSNAEGGNTSESSSGYFSVTVDPTNPNLHESARLQQVHVVSRLLTLQKMGLAGRAGVGEWQVRMDFVQILRAMQRSNDRQKTLAAHRALLSDERLPLQLTSIKEIKELEGRVLGHGQEDTVSRPYILIEGTDARVHYIPYTVTIDAARHKGFLRVNSFVGLYRKDRGHLFVQDFGDADKFLEDTAQMRTRAKRLAVAVSVVDEAPWGGWLGRYRAKLNAEVDRFRRTTQPEPTQSHGSRGRF
jgi:type IV secretory pathway VirD2 relaxase